MQRRRPSVSTEDMQAAPGDGSFNVGAGESREHVRHDGRGRHAVDENAVEVEAEQARTFINDDANAAPVRQLREE